MRHSYKILDARVARDHEQNKDFLDVKIQVFLDRVVTEEDLETNPDLKEEGVAVGETIGLPLYERSFGFPLETTKDEVAAELDKVVSCLDGEAEAKERNAEEDAKHDQAQATIAALMQDDAENAS